MDQAVNLGIAVFAFVGAALFASCDGGTGNAASGGAGPGGSSGGATLAGRGGSGATGAGAAGSGGTGSFPGVVPFDPVWSKTTPPDWLRYPIPSNTCDGCTYVNPDGVRRLVDSVRAQRADGRWSVFGDGSIDPAVPRAAWGIDLEARSAVRFPTGCDLTRDDGSRCTAGVPSVDSDFLVSANDRSTVQGVFVTRLDTGEMKRIWERNLEVDATGHPKGASLLATGMAYPYAFWVEAGIYRLDLRDGTVVHNPTCDVIEAVTVARNGLACCDGYGQGAVVIDFDHAKVTRYPEGFQNPNRVGIHSYLSKDGTELVWAEHPAGGRETDSYRIVYRNLVSGEERVVVENDDPTVRQNDFPVVEAGVVFWERAMVTVDPNAYHRTTGYWKLGDAKATFWERTVGQIRFTPYGLLGNGFPDHVPALPAPNLLFPYPDGYRPSTMVPPAP